MKHLAGVLVLAFFALASSSCSLFRTSTQTVTVTATDSSARSEEGAASDSLTSQARGASSQVCGKSGP